MNKNIKSNTFKAILRLCVLIIILSVGTMTGVAFEAIKVTSADLKAGSVFPLMEISHCSGDILVKVRSKNKLAEPDFILPNCNLQGALYHCRCLNPTSLVLQTKATTRNSYDVVVQYNPDGFDRTFFFNNLNVGEGPKEPRRSIFNRPPEDAKGFAGQVIGFVFIIIIIVIFVAIAFRKLLKGDGEKDIIDERYSWDRK